MGIGKSEVRSPVYEGTGNVMSLEQDDKTVLSIKKNLCFLSFRQWMTDFHNPFMEELSLSWSMLGAAKSVTSPVSQPMTMDFLCRMQRPRSVLFFAPSEFFQCGTVRYYSGVY